MVRVVHAGKADEVTRKNLMQLHLHDFGEFDGSPLNHHSWDR